MKVIIVDDEQAIRDGINLLIDWEKFGITERFVVGEAEAALQIAHRENPAVIFSDMRMPGVDGVELLQRLRAEQLHTQVIVVSGYDDYNYMKATIQAKGVDYILKPLRKSELESSLEKAVKQWREQHELSYTAIDDQYKLKKANAILHDRQILSFLNGTTEFSKQIEELFPLPFISHVGVFLIKNSQAILKRRFGGDSFLMDFAIRNIVLDALQSTQQVMLLHAKDDQWVWLSFADTDADTNTNTDTDAMPNSRVVRQFHKQIQSMALSLRQTIEIELLYGISSTVAPVTQAAVLMKEAQRSLLSCNILQINASVTPNANRDSTGPLLLTAKFERLSRMIESGSKQEISEFIHDFVQSSMKIGQLSLRELQGFTLEANLFLHRALDKYELNTIDRVDVEIPLWISDLNEWAEWFIHMLWGLQERLSGEDQIDRIGEIKKYIQSHYHTPLSLKEIAERFYLSPPYISRRFKETYGCTFIQFITEIRLMRAKSLLMHTSLPIVKIAELVGYEDEAYFSKVFKKDAGISPKQYRQQEDKNEQV